MARSPVIALTGGPTPRSRYRNFYQEVEDLSQFDPVTKFNARVDDPERLQDLLRQAFRVTTSGSPGPTHLQLRGALATVSRRKATTPSSSRRFTAAFPPIGRSRMPAGSSARSI